MSPCIVMYKGSIYSRIVIQWWHDIVKAKYHQTPSPAASAISLHPYIHVQCMLPAILIKGPIANNSRVPKHPAWLIRSYRGPLGSQSREVALCWRVCPHAWCTTIKAVTMVPCHFVYLTHITTLHIKGAHNLFIKPLCCDCWRHSTASFWIHSQPMRIQLYSWAVQIWLNCPICAKGAEINHIMHKKPVGSLIMDCCDAFPLTPPSAPLSPGSPLLP